MKIYNYHANTFEYLSEGEADESPLEEGVFLIPANATDIPPPTLKKDLLAFFENGTWTQFKKVSPLAPNPVLLEIRKKESTITMRRLREAVLDIDNNWLSNIDAEIAALRSGL